VYTAGKKKYADTVLDQLDESGVIEKRFYRDSCRKWECDKGSEIPQENTQIKKRYDFSG
jgi:hypothetical protein